MKTIKNKLLLVSGLATSGLFILGFFFLGSLMLYITESTLSNRAIFLTPSEPFQFRFFMGLLLALCLPVAILMSWVKTKSKDSIRPLTVTIYSIIPLLSAFIGMWLRVMEIKICILEPTASATIVPDFKLAFTSINLFKWGIISMLAVCIPAMYILSGRQKREQKTN